MEVDEFQQLVDRYELTLKPLQFVLLLFNVCFLLVGSGGDVAELLLELLHLQPFVVQVSRDCPFDSLAAGVADACQEIGFGFLLL